jgi:UDP-glucose:(heptosyl)LPS alpha-1,3-glucosyltransferase
MRLGVVRQRYTPFGGAERFVERALDALVAHGVRVGVYTRAWPRHADPRIEPVICNPLYVGGVWRDASFARAVRRALAHDRPDVVQTHERIEGCDVFRAGDGVHRAWLAERVRARGRAERLAIAVNPHHRYILDAEARVFADPSLKAVICISQMVKDDVRTWFDVPESKLRVIYNAVDPREFGPAVRRERKATRRAHGLADRHVAFVLVGSGYARKGVPAALRALSRLPEEGRLIVVGRDKSPARYERLARQLGVRARVAFVGPQRDVRPYLGAADAFVLPTLYDPLGNAVLEALACGLPVVTSTRCGAGELVVAHDAGFVCDANDDAAIAADMERLLEPTLRIPMSVRAGEAVAALTPDAMASELLALYRSLGVGPAL